MDPAMATTPAPGRAAARPPLRRDLQRRMLGGVCAGIAARLGVDPLLVRLAFVVAAAASGVGIALYALGWVAIPVDERGGAPARRLAAGRGGVEVALGAGLLLLSLLLTFRELGWWFSDAVVWPLVLVAAGAALLWRQSAATGDRGAPAPAGTEEPAVESAEVARERAAIASRTGVGVALVIAAGLVFLQATGALTAARDVLLAVLVVVVVLGVIFAPWVVRLVRSLTAERAERIRSQERAEMAAHLHDSVLQTLAMVQRRADDPREVSALARRQERELRSWLSGRTEAAAGARRLSEALEEAAEEIEGARGVSVEVVTVGDRDLDEATEALVAAAREAVTNAAKFGGGAPVDVYAEVEGDRVQVFVRDRGPGFDPAAVSPDRRGVRESIVGRMERHGGRARVTSRPGAGTEVELVLG
jgi:signal transduction histidine kinase/phage shock protein PspC (stress-responsive transcriptional regulator)